MGFFYKKYLTKIIGQLYLKIILLTDKAVLLEQVSAKLFRKRLNKISQQNSFAKDLTKLFRKRLNKINQQNSFAKDLTKLFRKRLNKISQQNSFAKDLTKLVSKTLSQKT